MLKNTQSSDFEHSMEIFGDILRICTFFKPKHALNKFKNRKKTEAHHF